MKKQFLFVSLSAISLCIGGAIYILFRPNTHISEFIRNILPTATIHFSNTETSSGIFLKYYLPDLLWSLSLYCGLNSLFNSKKNLFINGLMVLILGILWELAQYRNIISGTGDFLDILMYGTGVAIILTPNLIIPNKIKE